MRVATIGALLLVAASANDNDLFNYGFSDIDIDGGTDYGQQNWEEVACDDLDACAGYPDKFQHSIGFSVAGSSDCRWCPENGPQNCGLHRQSPINLQRNRAVPGDPMEKECIDWHFMHANEGSCNWEDLSGSSAFEIARHALKINLPIQSDGQVDCVDDAGLRRFPRTDYSKGFPDWWWLDHTSITVPSQHTQEGKRYDAEISLNHFYEINHPKNQLGTISVFMEAYDDVDPWPMLDKLICQWRQVEEEARESCGLDPAPPYGRCALFRDQDPTEEWTAEANGELFGFTYPPSIAPSLSVATNETEPPSAALGGAASSKPTALPPVASTPAPWTGSPTGAPSASDFGAAGSTLPTISEPPSIPWWQTWGDLNGAFPTPTAAPGAMKNGTTASGVPEPIDCSAYSSYSIDRMCASSQPCCESTRSETTFCWDMYENVFPGALIESACYHCCATPKVVGPPAKPLPELPKTVECSAIDSPYRICKPDSCCVNPRSTSEYCTEIYDQYGDEMDQICHYCCADSQTVGPAIRRNLRGHESSHGKELAEGSATTQVHGRRLVLGPENFIENEDKAAYMEKRFKEYSRRKLAGTQAHEEDYADVAYGTYDWLIEAGTEYYFRYEGTMPIPPCWEVVHWRVLKDPIRVHPRQIAELNRLLAWRLSTSGSNECEVDTAGRLSDDGNTVDLSREIQYYHSLHREVFCECKDWPSKFEGDKKWCEDWKTSDATDRFYTTPYNFDTGGQW